MKWIGKSIVGITLILMVTSCSWISQKYQNPVNQNRLVAVESGYGIVLSAALVYKALPPCAPSETITISRLCKDAGVITQLQVADRKVQAALVAARNFVDKNPTVDASGIIQVVTDAINDFKATMAKYNIAVPQGA